jgi:hypothetical protein
VAVEVKKMFGLPEHRDTQEELMGLMQSHMERVGDPMCGPFMQVRQIY